MDIHASLKAEDVLLLGPVHITNSMVMAWITIFILALFGYAAGRNPQLVPTGVQNFFEFIMEALMSLVQNTAGHYARRVFPLIATLFIFILTANYLALFPGVGTVWVHNPHVPFEGGASTHAAGVRVAEAASGTTTSSSSSTTSSSASKPAAPVKEKHEPVHTPLFRAANADVNMTLGMGLIAFLFIHASGMVVHGAWGYIKNDLCNPLLMTPIKLIIEMFLPVSLSMRLFGNVFGGEMLLTVMAFPVIAVLFMFAELFFGFIQAVIFSILTLIFTSVATYVPPGHGHDEHGEEGHGHAAHAEHVAAPAH
jgi:F-type H+-transporting ATPase subunit a